MVLGVVKSNLAMKPDPLIWTRAEDGPITWHGVSDQNVEDLLQGAVSKAPRADAEGFLRELLAAGSMASADVEQEAKEAGISWRTLRRAADDIGVVKWRQGGADGHWRWRLPDGQPAMRSHAERRCPHLRVDSTESTCPLLYIQTWTSWTSYTTGTCPTAPRVDKFTQPRQFRQMAQSEATLWKVANLATWMY